MRKLVMIAVCLAASGCVELGNHFDIDRVDQLRPGSSTEADAVNLLGQPVSVVTDPANRHQLVIWQYANGNGLGTGSAAKLAVSFDEHGTMIMVVQRTTVGTSMFGTHVVNAATPAPDAGSSQTPNPMASQQALPAPAASAPTTSQRVCTQAEETQKRIAIRNGYTMIPNCQ
jgi:outer membrane protein assembly factor BamE (lipoprotein component of BamABCDE complex)